MYSHAEKLPNLVRRLTRVRKINDLQLVYLNGRNAAEGKEDVQLWYIGCGNLTMVCEWNRKPEISAGLMAFWLVSSDFVSGTEWRF